MSYIVNGKTYTSYPLLDDIVYNSKMILNGIVVKNEYVAHLYETEETLYNQEILFKCTDGTMTFSAMPYTAEMLVAFGYDEMTANQYVADISLIPEQDRDRLLNFCTQYYIDNYIEKNKYYRSLMGLPEYGTDRYNIYLTEDDFPSSFDLSLVDLSLPIHEQSDLVISVVRENGKLNELIEQYRSFNYSYLRFLSDLALDPYKCRKAKKWDILYIPQVNNTILFRFQQLYDINRQIYLKRTYQTAYAFRSDYYDHMLIFIVLAQTFSDMIVDAPEWFIRKDIFDIRTVQFFLEAYGMPFFEEIPLKYQIRLVKNINKLLTYKATEQNFQDIIDIFRMDEVYVYKYYLYKKKRTDEEGNFIEDQDLNKKYELLFLEVLLGDTYDNYIKSLANRKAYDEITMLDPYWDGTESHKEVKDKILAKEFTIEPTKYLSIKADVDFINYQRQLIYLLGLIVDSRVKDEGIGLNVQSIYEGIDFRLSNIFIFVELLNYLEFNLDSKIRRPEDNFEEELPMPTEKIGKNSWIYEKYPEIFVTSKNRVFGFNPEANLEEINEVLGRGYKSSLEKTYSLADFGCDTFIVPNGTIDTYDKLLNIYETNMKCYEKINNFITHQCSDQLERLFANYVYTQLFTKVFDYNFSNQKEYLSDILRSRDYILWSFYDSLEQATDEDSRNKDIETVINEIVLNLEYYFDRDSLDYFFSFTSTSSFAALSKYIYLLLNAFKSYKAHFITPVVKYRYSYPDMIAGNYMSINDEFMNRHITFSKFDKEYIHDYLLIKIFKCVFDSERERYFEILDIFTKFDPDPDDDYDYDGGGPDTQENEYIKELDGTQPIMLLPYKTSNGGYPYGYQYYDKFQLNGNDESIITDSSKVLEIDGGIIDNENQYLDTNSSTFYFNKAFSKSYNSGRPKDDWIINNNFFKRVFDYQDHHDIIVAGRTGLSYSEDEDEAILTEKWRQCLSILEFEAVQGDLDLFNKLIDENRFESFYNNFLSDLEDGKIDVFLDELDQRNGDHSQYISISDIDASNPLYKVIWIEDIYNHDTSRSFKYPL